jgi:hypothetical protein
MSLHIVQFPLAKQECPEKSIAEKSLEAKKQFEKSLKSGYF